MAMLPPDSPVELVHWPRDEAQRARLARSGVPCLLLVAPDADLPVSFALTEDWLRLPADERDVHARVQLLCRRLAFDAMGRPVVGNGVVEHA